MRVTDKELYNAYPQDVVIHYIYKPTVDHPYIFWLITFIFFAFHLYKKFTSSDPIISMLYQFAFMSLNVYVRQKERYLAKRIERKGDWIE